MKLTTVILFPTVALAANIPHYVRALPPGASVNPTTASGVFGPFTPARTAAAGATGAPTAVSNQVAQQLQQACNNWSQDTGMVSNFLNIGKGTAAGTQFNSAANVAFKAEVDELTWKAVLDKYIGNDPQVSIANLTLTNGVFQSVVDNLDIMAVQGKAKQSLIDTINSVRCTQILPSINTYMLVAARIINGTANGAVQSIPPAACAGILQQNANNPAAFPNVPNVPGGTPLAAAGSTSSGTTGTTGTGTGNTGAGTGTGTGSAAGSSSSATTGTGTTGGRGKGGNGGNANAGTGSGTTGANGGASAGTAGTTSSSAAAGASTAGAGNTGTNSGSAGSTTTTTGKGHGHNNGN